MNNDFNYFDQYYDIEIDLSKYLENISSFTYNYNFSNIQPVKTNIKDLFNYYELITSYQQNIDIIVKYTIQENEKVEQVSYNNYKSIDYWWIIFIFNNIKNPFLDWPLNQNQLIELVDNMYLYEGKYSRSTYYDYLFEQNEAKRNIILPKSYAINDIIWSYRQKILEYE